MTALPKLKPIAAAVRPAVSRLSWLVGGVLLSTAVMVSAQYYNDSSQPQPEDCELKDAISQTVNNRIKIVGMTSPDPAKYFSVGGTESCLGNISLADIDLSQMIPDFAGILTSAVTNAIEQAIKAAIRKACTAARSTISDYITKYNDAVDTINGAGDYVADRIDAEVGKAVSDAAAQYGIDYNIGAGSGTGGDTYTIKPPASGNGLFTGGQTNTNLLNKTGQNAADLTNAAANRERARINLEQAKSYAAMFANQSQGETGASLEYQMAQQRLQQAQQSYDLSVRDYARIEHEVNSRASAAAARPSGASSASAPRATTGSSVF